MAAKKKPTNTAPKEEAPSNGNTQQSDAMISIGGLWANTSRSGEFYLSGYFGNAKLYIFKNKNKRQEKQPDYYMTIAPSKPKNGTQSAEAFEAQTKDDFRAKDQNPFEGI